MKIRISARPLLASAVVTLLLGAFHGTASADTLLSVLVKDERGVLQQNARVEATSARGTTLSTHFADDGSYFIAGLAPGTWHVSCNATWFYPSGEDIEIPDGQEVHKLELVLKRISIRIRLLDADGKATHRPFLSGPRDEWIQDSNGSVVQPPLWIVPSLEQLPSELSPYPGRYGYWHYIGHDLGRFFEGPDDKQFCEPGGGCREVHIPKGCFGILELASPPPLHASLTLMNQVLASELLEPGQDEVEFTVSREDMLKQLSTVKLRLIDAETSKPVTGARIGFKTYDQLPGPAFGNVSIADDGSVLLTYQVPGLQELWIDAPGYEDFGGSFDSPTVDVRNLFLIPAGETIDLGEVKLHRPTSISGVVQNANGQPVANASVWIRNLDRVRFPQPIYPFAVSPVDANGAFSIEGMGKGRYMVVAGARDGASWDWYGTTEWACTPVVVDASKEPVKDLKLTLDPGTQVVVRAGADTPVQSVATIEGEQGKLFWSDELLPGRFSTLRLVPGKYKIRAYDLLLENWWLERSLEVGEDSIVVDL